MAETLRLWRGIGTQGPARNRGPLHRRKSMARTLPKCGRAFASPAAPIPSMSATTPESTVPNSPLLMMATQAEKRAPCIAAAEPHQRASRSRGRGGRPHSMAIARFHLGESVRASVERADWPAPCASHPDGCCAGHRPHAPKSRARAGIGVRQERRDTMPSRSP